MAAQETVDSIIGQPAFDQIKQVLAGLDAVAQAQKIINDASRAAGGKMAGAQNTRQVVDATAQIEKLERKLAAARDENTKKVAALTEKVKQATLAARAQAQADIAQEGSLNKLRAQLILAQRQWDKMGASTRDFTATGKAAKAEVDRLTASVKTLEESTGRHQRSVGHYEKGFNSLGNSINQLTREMPAFGNSLQTGFMAISNNIPALFDGIASIREQNKGLAAEGKEPVSILESLAEATFSWQTVLSVGVTLLTIYGEEIVGWVKGLFGAAEASEAAAKAMEAYHDEIKSAESSARTSANAEIARIQVLTTIAADVTASTRSRSEAINELQKTYPAYFGNLDQEAIKQGKVTTALKEATAAILAKAAAQAAEKKFGTAADTIYDLELQQREVQKKIDKVQITYGPKQGIQQAPFMKVEYRMKLGRLIADYDALTDAIKIAKAEQAVFLTDAKTNAAAAGDMFTKDFTPEKAAKEGKPKRNKDAEDLKDLLEDVRKAYAAINREATNTIGSNELEDQRDAKLKMYGDMLTGVLESIDSGYVQQLTIIETQYQQGLFKTVEDYEKAKETLEVETAKRKLQAQIMYWKDMASLLAEGSKERIGYERMIQAAELAIIQAGNKAKATDDKATLEKRKKDFEKALSDMEKASTYFTKALGSARDIASALAARELNELSAKEKAIDRVREKEINAINATTLSQEEKVRKIAEIEGRALAQKEALEERQLQIRQRQARFERAMTIAEIIADTALATVRALGMKPYTPANIALAGVTAALGAAQIAAVALTPLPQYAEGTDRHPGGPAIMGERGVEMVREPSGKTWLTADRATLYENLASGARVIPHDEVVAMAGRSAHGMTALNRAPAGIDLTELVDATRQNTKAVTRAIQSLPAPQVHIHGGYEAYIKQNMQS